jgi:hypothetical protein
MKIMNNILLRNSSSLHKIADLLEKCYKLNDAVKGSSATKILAKELSKEVKDQSIKLSKSVIKKQFIGLSGGAVGEFIAAIGSVYSLTSTTIELCDNIQLGARVYGTFTSLKGNTSSVIDLVKDALSKKCDDNGDTDDISELVTNLTQKLTVRADDFLSLLNKISLAGTRNDIESQLRALETGQSGFNANAQATKDKLKDECDEDYTNECKQNDFEVSELTKTKGPNRKNIACRVFYISPSIIRSNPQTLKEYLTETNKARDIIEKNTNVPLDPTKKRTIATAKIGNSFVYDMNGNRQSQSEVVLSQINNLSSYSFIPDLPTNRFFRGTDGYSVLNRNSYHAEIRLLEYIASQKCDDVPIKLPNSTKNDTFTVTFSTGNTRTFNKYDCNNTEIRYFTDRATCGMCSFSMSEIVNKGLKNISLINENALFPSGSRLGVFYEGESIIKKDSNFFMNLKLKP